ncbi:hypothetical protein MHYP_G00219440 [Metynnis hypsauchen]
MKDAAAAELLGHREALKCRLAGGADPARAPRELAPGSDAVEGATLLPGDDIGVVGSKRRGVPGEREGAGQAAAAPAAAEPQPSRTPRNRNDTAPRLHPGAAQRARAQLRQDALPGHLHARGARAAHRPHGVPRAAQLCDQSVRLVFLLSSDGPGSSRRAVRCDTKAPLQPRDAQNPNKQNRKGSRASATNRHSTRARGRRGF